ncbi:MAG: sigma-70 family RNA polymerase sigma factor [Planctomycetota bacterium]
MNEGSSTIDPRSVLEQAPLVRALARRLLADEHLVDDVVQQTWLKALEAPPRCERSLRSWLTKVARRIAARMGRQAERRMAWEAHAAVNEALPPADATLQRAEMLRMVVGAVLGLPEPARSTVLMRYLDELPDREIARRMNVPVETVRTRLKRAIITLRAMLEQQHGDRREWALVLATLGWKPPATTVIAGAALIDLKVKIVATVVLVIGLSATAWRLTRDDVWHPAHRGADTPPPVELPAPPITAAIPDRSEVATSSTAPPAAAATSDDDIAVAPNELCGRVLDPDGAPVANAQVVATRWEPMSGRDPDSDVTTPRLGVTSTGAQGEFSMERPRVPLVDLSVTAAGFPVAEVSEHPVDRFVTVRLRRGGTVFGKVTREADGLPVARVRVSASWSPVPRAKDRVETRTDASGNYRLEGVVPRRVSLWIIPEQEAWQELEISVSDGGELRQDVAVKLGGTLRGTVTEALGGAPIAGAEISVGQFAPKIACTDERGEYQLTGVWVPPSSVDVVHVRAAGFGTSEQNIEDFTEGIKAIDFALARAREARGRVIDARGEPVAGAYVAAVASAATSGFLQWRRRDWISARTERDGTFALRGLRPDAPHALLVAMHRYGSVLHDFPASEATQASIDLGDIALPPPGSIAGRVVDAAGGPMKGVLVLMHGWNDDRFRFSGGERATLTEDDVGRRTAHTSEDGRFRFEDLAAGEYGLNAWLRDSGPGDRQKVSLGAGEDRAGVEIVIAGGLSIDGTVVDTAGEPVAHVQAFMNLESDPKVWRVAMCEDGRFHFERLPAGLYTISATPLPLADGSQAPRLLCNVSVSGVEAGARDVRVIMPEGSAISGTVLKPDGTPGAGAMVWAHDDARQSDAFANDAGQFALVVPKGGRYYVSATLSHRFQGPLGKMTTADPPMHAYQRDVLAGATDVTLRLHEDR